VGRGTVKKSMWFAEEMQSFKQGIIWRPFPDTVSAFRALGFIRNGFDPPKRPSAWLVGSGEHQQADVWGTTVLQPVSGDLSDAG